MRRLISFSILLAHFMLIFHGSFAHHEHETEECQACLVLETTEFSEPALSASLLEVPKSFFKSFEKVFFQEYFFYFYFDNTSRGPPKKLFA